MKTLPWSRRQDVARKLAPTKQGGREFRRLQPGSSGFSLLELLVAVTITLVLAAILLAIVLNTLGLWHRVQGEISCAAQARSVFALMERDLHGALYRDDSGVWLAAELQNSTESLRDNHGWLTDVPANGCIKPATDLSLEAVPDAGAGGIAVARFASGGAWLRLFSLDDTGAPMAVSFQLVRRPPSGNANLSNPSPSRYLFFRSTATDLLARGRDITSGYDDALAAPTVVDVLAENVVDFGIWLYVRDASVPDGLRRVFPVNAADTDRYAAPGGGTAALGNAFPDVADVMVRVLTDEGATLLANLEAGRGRALPATDAEWWSVVVAHSTVFIRRVELKGAAQ